MNTTKPIVGNVDTKCPKLSTCVSELCPALDGSFPCHLSVNFCSNQRAVLCCQHTAESGPVFEDDLDFLVWDGVAFEEALDDGGHCVNDVAILPQVLKSLFDCGKS